MKESLDKKNNAGLLNIWQMIFHAPRFLKIFWRLMKDRRVPWYAKAMPILALIYIISPIDLIPELFVPILGCVDDIIALFLGFKGLVFLTPHDIIEEHITKIEQGL